jgi:hypothetical protein
MLTMVLSHLSRPVMALNPVCPTVLLLAYPVLLVYLGFPDLVFLRQVEFAHYPAQREQAD